MFFNRNHSPLITAKSIKRSEMVFPMLLICFGLDRIPLLDCQPASLFSIRPFDKPPYNPQPCHFQNPPIIVLAKMGMLHKQSSQI